MPLLRCSLPPTPFPFPHPKDLPNFEQPYVPIAVRPVVFDPTGQTREEPAPQMGLVGRQRLLDRVGRRPGGRTERDGASLVQAGPSELLAHPRLGLLQSRIRHGPGPVRAQLVRERVVPLEAGDFLDQVHLARHVGTPARYLHGESPIFGGYEEPHRGEEPLDLRPLDADAEQAGYALGPEEDRRLPDRLWAP